MQWSCAHSLNGQENIVKFCIKQAQRVKLVSKQHEHNISILQDQRHPKEGEQFKEEDRKEVAMCGRKGSGIIR